MTIPQIRGIRIARSQLGGWLTVRDIDGPQCSRVRVMQSGGVFQTALRLDRPETPVFEYIRAFDAMFDPQEARPAMRKPLERVLMLGGGGFSYPHHVLACRNGVSIDVVEADGAALGLARRYFGVAELEERHGTHGDARLRVFHADATDFLHGYAGPGYDAIIDDAFVGRRHVSEIADRDGVALVASRLSRGGMYLVNVVCDADLCDSGDGDELLDRHVAALAGVFSHVHAIPCTDHFFSLVDNWLLIGTDAEYSFAGEIPR